MEGIGGAGADTVFEMEIGTNRPDAMNHYGVAREAAAIYDLPLKALNSETAPASKGEANFPIQVEEPQLCPRFSARVIHGTRIKPSPERLRTACNCSISGRSAMRSMPPITFCGRWASPRMSSISTCLKAGDHRSKGEAGEKLKTLDGVERKLTSEDLGGRRREKAGRPRGSDGRLRHHDH